MLHSPCLQNQMKPFIYREPGSCQRFPRAELATLRAKGGGSEYVDKMVFQVGTDFHEVSEYRVT